MNQDEFLSKLFSLYANSFNRGNGQTWLEAYKKALSNPNIDYDDLFDFVVCEYSGQGAPKPSLLKENAKYLYSDEANREIQAGTFILSNGMEWAFSLKVKYDENTVKDIHSKNLNIVKVKFCDKNCQRCQYNHVCQTAKEKRA